MRYRTLSTTEKKERKKKETQPSHMDESSPQRLKCNKKKQDIHNCMVVFSFVRTS